MAGTMDKIKAKVDQALHKDKTHDTTTGTGHTGTTGHSTTAGHGTTGGLTGSSTTGGYGMSGHSDPTGPHDSKLGNKADPRVDSDRYGASGNTSGAGGYGTGQYGEGHHTTGGGLTGSGPGHTSTGGGLTGSSTTGGYGHSDPTGPHDSKLANKADPRVDSDRYGASGNTAGAGGYGTGQYGAGQHNTGHHTTGHGTTGTGGGLTGALGGEHYTSDPTGPHDTRTANKLDPRVDSDRYGAAGNTTGAGGYSNTSGGIGHHNDPSGPHDSRLGNKADPRVDSDRYGAAGNTSGAGGYGTGQYGEGHHTAGHGTTGHSTTGGYGGNTVGSGNSDKTAGPHSSDMMNKLDPRVDSDLDGSKTYGGNATRQ